MYCGVRGKAALRGRRALAHRPCQDRVFAPVEGRPPRLVVERGTGCWEGRRLDLEGGRGWPWAARAERATVAVKEI